MKKGRCFKNGYSGVNINKNYIDTDKILNSFNDKYGEKALEFVSISIERINSTDFFYTTVIFKNGSNIDTVEVIFINIDTITPDPVEVKTDKTNTILNQVYYTNNSLIFNLPDDAVGETFDVVIVVKDFSNNEFIYPLSIIITN